MISSLIEQRDASLARAKCAGKPQRCTPFADSHASDGFAMLGLLFALWLLAASFALPFICHGF